VDGDAVFVSHEPSAAAGGEFDDIVAWVPVHVLASRLMAAGGCPDPAPRRGHSRVKRSGFPETI
jgi:hypothetical protein